MWWDQDYEVTMFIMELWLWCYNGYDVTMIIMLLCLCGYDVLIIIGLLYFMMIVYVEMFSFIKCEVYDVIRGYYVTMWPIELLYVMCTYDELNYYMK